MTQYNKRDMMSTFENIEILALSNRRFYKLSNDTKFIKIEVIFLKIQASQCVNFLLFSLYFAHYFVHYLRMNLADIMSLLLYWVTIVIVHDTYYTNTFFSRTTVMSLHAPTDKPCTTQPACISSEIHF